MVPGIFFFKKLLQISKAITNNKIYSNKFPLANNRK